MGAQELFTHCTVYSEMVKMIGFMSLKNKWHYSVLFSGPGVGGSVNNWCISFQASLISCPLSITRLLNGSYLLQSLSLLFDPRYFVLL